MRARLAFIIGFVALGGAAQAQSAGYAEAVGQAAFGAGNVTSQSFGAEGGFTVTPALQIFFEGGRTRGFAAPTSDLPIVTATAQVIVQALNAAAGNRFSATVTNEHPLTFFAAGVKYRITPGRAIEPYVMGGLGGASYDTTEVVRFFSGTTDITSQLSQYGVQLGTDIVGRGGPVTKPMLLLGGGVSVAVWRHVMIDVQYRFGDIFADNQAVYLNRVGIGIGARF